MQRNIYIRTVIKPEPPVNLQQKKRKNHMDTIRKSLQNVPLLNYNMRIKETQQSQLTKSSSGKEDPESLLGSPIDTLILQIMVSSAELFLEEYEILDKLGEGSTGVVHRCKKRINGQLYAVKSFEIDDQQISEIKTNFLIMKKLKHPNIIKYQHLMLDMKKRSGWLIMELIKGKPIMKAELKNEKDIKGIIFQIMEALYYLHQRDIAHRDIKSSNILFCQETGKIKIIDFGISKKFRKRANVFNMWTITGTLYYRAPEMFSGGGYQQGVDIWATGVLLYKMITRKTPFESEYHHQTIKNICQGSFELPVIFQHYSIHLKQFLLKLLESNPDKRPSSFKCLQNIWFSLLNQVYLTKKEKLSLGKRTSNSKDKPRKMQINNSPKIIKEGKLTKKMFKSKNNHNRRNLQQVNCIAEIQVVKQQ